MIRGNLLISAKDNRKSPFTLPSTKVAAAQLAALFHARLLLLSLASTCRLRTDDDTQDKQRRSMQTCYLQTRRALLHRAPCLRPVHCLQRRCLQSYHFDTQQFVARLEDDGLTKQQAIGVMSALQDVVQESMNNMVSNLVTRAEQEKYQYTQKVDFAKLKSEVTLVEKQDYSLLKAENDRLLADVEKLKQRLREEISRTSAGVRLDLNLEKGRIRDELNTRELKIREVDTRIDTEIAGLRGAMEAAKFSIMSYIVGLLTGGGALMLAYLRIIK